MWEVLVKLPLGRLSMRKFIMLFATLLVAAFAYASIGSTSVSAAPKSATWNSDGLTYNGRDYSGPETSDGSNPPGIPSGILYYTSFDQSNSGPSKGYLIYFKDSVNADNVSKATKAQYRTGDYDLMSGIFSNLSPPQAVSIDSSSYANRGDTKSAVNPTSDCNVDGVGWIVCPVSRWIAGGMDYLYKIVASFLTVAPISTNTAGPMYQMWRLVLGVANILFIVAFLILIYAQVSGGLLTNYTIKKTLPRIIVAAVLVNISYWLCAVAVDVSNVLGASVYDLMQDILRRLGPANSSGSHIDFSSINWSNVTAAALGSGAVIGGITIAAATAGGAGALGFMIIAALIPALFAVFVAVGILAARQALITIFVVISPLAFVAYLLPNTEEWFTRWRKLFISMLVMFPAFSVIFSGAQIAGVLIIQTAHSLPVVILGLVVQVVPLFITPFLIKLSSGLLSTITGHINDRSKGMFDRAQNWANANKDLHRERAIRNGMARRPDLSWKKGNRWRTARALARPTVTGSYLATRGQHREKMMAAYKAQSEGYYGQTRSGQRSYKENKVGELSKALSHANNEEMWQARVGGHVTSTRRTQRGRDREDAEYREYQHMTHAAHSAEGRAKLYEGKTQAEGEEVFRREVEASTALKRVVKDTHHANKQAEAFEQIVQKAAEKSWNDRVRNDQATRELHLKSVRFEDGAKLAEEKVTTFVENVRAKGANAPGISTMEQVVARQIQETHEEIEVQSNATASAKIVQQRNLAQALKSNEQLRIHAAGVDDQGGMNRVLASAKKAVSEELIKATNNFQDTLDYDIASNPEALDTGFRSASDPTEKIVYARLMARNAPGLKKLKAALRDYTAARDPEDDEVMLLKEVLGADGTFRDAGRDLEVWANNERKPDGNLYSDFEDVQDTIGVINNISADRFSRMNAYSQLDALYRLQENDPTALENLLERINASPMARNALKPAVTNSLENIANGQRISSPDAYNIDDE